VAVTLFLDAAAKARVSSAGLYRPVKRFIR
jgi:hypothetical protein